jgi:hypothetical protein
VQKAGFTEFEDTDEEKIVSMFKYCALLIYREVAG